MHTTRRICADRNHVSARLLPFSLAGRHCYWRFTLVTALLMEKKIEIGSSLLIS